MPLRNYFFFTLILFGTLSRAEDWKPITPEELKYTEPGVPAVILYESEETDDTHSSRHKYVRIKVLSDEGKKYGTVEIPYNREFSKIGDIRGRTIRADGSIVPFDGKVYEKTVLKGHGIKILEKAFSLPDVQVGSIIEYKYGTYWPDNRLPGARWIVQDELKKLRAHYSYKPYERDNVITSHGNIGGGVFWFTFLPSGPKPVQNQMTHIVELDLTNVPAFQEEEFMPPSGQMKYRVTFYYGGGRDLTKVDQFWKEEGKYWNKEVNKFLSSGSAVTALVNEAGIAATDTPEAKAKKIYDRVQKLENLSYARERTAAEDKLARYKPPKNAEDVAKFGAGFRTDITRLYVAAARAAGLKAYPMEVSTRDEFFFLKEVPDAEQLNSEIAIVDVGGKDTFVDPGTKTCPFGLLEWKRTGVTGIRQTASGDAAFADTPFPDVNKSSTVRVAQLTLKPDGSAEGEVSVAFRGQEALVHRVPYLDMDEQGRKKDLEDEVRQWIPDGSEATLKELKNTEAADEPLVATFSVTVPQLATAAGKRMLLPAALFETRKKQVLMHSERTLPIYFSYPYREIDQAVIFVPQGVQVDTLPENKDVNNGFAIYRTKHSSAGNRVVLDRDFAVLGIGLPLKYYPQLKSFFESVKSGDDEQIVLKGAPNAVAEKGTN